ncbi:MAG: hypothetical protein ACI4NA_03975 [Succinivibrio sp.]
MGLAKLAAAAAISALITTGCTVIQGITDSDGGSGPQIQDADASQNKADHGAAARGKSSTRALENQKPSKDQAQKQKQDEAKAQEPQGQQQKAADELKPAAGQSAPDPDEEAALRNTEVSAAELAGEAKEGQAAQGQDGGNPPAGDGAGDKGSDSNSQAAALPPVDEETAQQISDLPDYATASGRQTCPASLGSSAQSAASELGKALAGKLNIDKGAVFCAPTVIPDEYSDCISDVSAAVASALAASGKFDMADSGRVQVAQNSGSAMLIPAYVRECRRNGIPYLAVSVVRKIGGKVSLTLRILRADTGVTLTQSYRRI